VYYKTAWANENVLERNL